jgi:hypothetical protein
LALTPCPLTLRGFPLKMATKTSVSDGQGGSLTKVLIQHVHGTGNAQLTAVSCATETPVRLCYPACHVSLGSDVPKVRHSTIFVLIHLAGTGDYTGYVLFPTPGNYLLDVESGGTSLGSGLVTRSPDRGGGVSSPSMEHESYWIVTSLVAVILFIVLAVRDHFFANVRSTSGTAKMWAAILPPLVAVLLPLVMLSGMLKENGNLRLLEIVCIVSQLIQVSLTGVMPASTSVDG